MSDNVIRFCDYDKRSREPDAVQPRDPCDATIIILPVIRRFNEVPSVPTCIEDRVLSNG
jgi:phosphatidylserine decarboxylase